jgi:hypothetical protein
MLQQIKLLCEILTNIDNDPSKCMQFYTSGGYMSHRQNPATTQTPTSDCRWLLIVEALQHIDNENYHDFLRKLNADFVETQHLCWKSHDHHFHVDFHRYVLCPVTCLYEVVEYLNKLIKEMYIV